MEVDLTTFLEGKLLYLIVFLAFLVLLVIILLIIHSRLKRVVIQKEKDEEKESSLVNEIDKFKKSNNPPHIILESIDQFTRNLLKDTFNMPKSMDYGEMAEFFKEKNKDNIAILCQQMLMALYSGEKLEKKSIDYIIRNLEVVIEEEHPLIKDIKEDELRTQLHQLQQPQQKQILAPKIVEKQIIPLPISPIGAPLTIQKIEDDLRKIRQLEEQKNILPNMQLPEMKIALPPIKIEEKPKYDERELKKIKEALPLGIMVQQMPKNEMITKINRLDNEQIDDVYRLLQKKYHEAYSILKAVNDNANVKKLEEYRENLLRLIKEYEVNRNLPPLAMEISKGVRLVTSIIHY